MPRNQINVQLVYRYSFLVTLLLFSAVVAQGQSGGGIDMTGTGGMHSIIGRLVFPSGQRTDLRLKIRLESPGLGDLSVLSDLNGNFSFQSLRPGNYTVIIDGGEYFDTVRENVFIEPSVVASRNPSGAMPFGRPFNLQIYLRPKTEVAAANKPGVLNAALAGVPKAAVQFYDNGLAAVNRGETDKAIDHFKKAVDLYPDFGLALKELGVQYLKKGELDKAEEVLARAHRLLPEASEPILNYGIVLLQKKKFGEAEVQLRDAVKRNDQSFTAHLYLGITLISSKNYSEAEAELRKAVTLGGPKAGQAHYYLGGLYWQTGSFKQAADELEVYLKLEPRAGNAEKIKTTIKELRAKS